MELMEDLLRRNTVCTKAEDRKAELFPSKGEKISKVSIAIRLNIYNYLPKDKQVASPSIVQAPSHEFEIFRDITRNIAGKMRYYAEYFV